VIVCLDLDIGRSTPWPDDIRAALTAEIAPRDLGPSKLAADRAAD
jgi:hypothetical protein